MKTPIWEAYAGATDAILHNASRTFIEADCYTITCKSGPVLRFTNAGLDVAFAGNRFSSAMVRFDDKQQRAVGHSKVGLDVDTWQTYIYPRIYDVVSGLQTFPDKIGSFPFAQAAHAHLLDLASTQVDRAYFLTLPDPLPGNMIITPGGVLRQFDGTIAAIDITDPGLVITINSLLDKLNRPVPTRLFQVPCTHTLYDPDCGLTKASFGVNGTVGSGGTNQIIKSGISGPPGSGTFALGTLTMTTGQNAGFSRLVRVWDGSQFILSAPFYFDLQVGDQFTAYAGCDKSHEACALFANTDNYDGQRFIPPPEVAV